MTDADMVHRYTRSTVRAQLPDGFLARDWITFEHDLNTEIAKSVEEAIERLRQKYPDLNLSVDADD